MNKFKGNEKRLKWFLKKIESGEVKSKVPVLNSWETELLNFFNLTVSKNGLDIVALKIIFEANGLPIDSKFYQTCLILAKSFQKMKE